MTPPPTCTDGSRHIEDMDEPEGSSLDTAPVDWSDMQPIGDEHEFAAMVDELVADETPRLFAVVQEYGERVDGRVAAWGLAFADHTEVVFAEYDRRMSLPTPDKALRAFTRGRNIRARLVWINPAAVLRTESEEKA